MCVELIKFRWVVSTKSSPPLLEWHSQSVTYWRRGMIISPPSSSQNSFFCRVQPSFPTTLRVEAISSSSSNCFLSLSLFLVKNGCSLDRSFIASVFPLSSQRVTENIEKWRDFCQTRERLLGWNHLLFNKWNHFNKQAKMGKFWIRSQSFHLTLQEMFTWKGWITFLTVRGTIFSF